MTLTCGNCAACAAGALPSWQPLNAALNAALNVTLNVVSRATRGKALNGRYNTA
jgi:hypothetical protein